MSEQRTSAIGWGLVAIQAVLLIGLVALPGSDAWPTPGWLRFTSTALVALGLLIVLVASTRLGRLITPTPVPKADGALVTGGLYRWVRHPIYSGVLVIVVGLVLPSGNLITLILGTATLGFFLAKSSWEEQRLVDRYPDYESYRERTPRFVPRMPH